MKHKLIYIACALVVCLGAITWWALEREQSVPSTVAPGKSAVGSIFDAPLSQGSSMDAGGGHPAATAQARAMHKALPGNVFLPPLPDQGDRVRVDKRNHLLHRLRKIHYKIEAGRASGDERAEYYSFRIKYNRDKIAMLQYVAVRGKTPGADANAMAPHISEMIRELREEIKTFRKKTSMP